MDEATMNRLYCWKGRLHKAVLIYQRSKNEYASVAALPNNRHKYAKSLSGTQCYHEAELALTLGFLEASTSIVGATCEAYARSIQRSFDDYRSSKEGTLTPKRILAHFVPRSVVEGVLSDPLWDNGNAIDRIMEDHPFVDVLVEGIVNSNQEFLVQWRSILSDAHNERMRSKASIESVREYLAANAKDPGIGHKNLLALAPNVTSDPGDGDGDGSVDTDDDDTKSSIEDDSDDESSDDSDSDHDDNDEVNHADSSSDSDDSDSEDDDDGDDSDGNDDSYRSIYSNHNPLLDAESMERLFLVESEANKERDRLFRIGTSLSAGKILISSLRVTEKIEVMENSIQQAGAACIVKITRATVRDNILRNNSNIRSSNHRDDDDDETNTAHPTEGEIIEEWNQQVEAIKVDSIYRWYRMHHGTLPLT